MNAAHGTSGILRVAVFGFVFLVLNFLIPGFSYSEEHEPGEYEFDISEFEKKPYSFGGYAEFRPVLFGLDRDAAFYKLRFFDRDEGDTTYEYNLGALIDLSYQKDIAEVFIQPNILYTDSYKESELDMEMFQGYLSLKPSTSVRAYAGKRTVKWGKGYAWNPVGFIERPKDPNDPDLAREGFVMLIADYTKSFEGALRAVSLSPALIPVYENVNEDFGGQKALNFAGKVYLLLYDTDIDFMLLLGDSKSNRYGFDFSRNITSNFEVHGEFAFIDDFEKKIVDSSGKVTESVSDVVNYLVGLRYLSAADTIYILEYYQNGTGYSAAEMRDFYFLAEKGFQDFLATGDDSVLSKAEKLSGAYGGQNPMRHYLYLRISQKEPFEILYLTPAITGIYNLSDSSFSLSPEILYKGITNLEVRLKAGILSGEDETEYGEKQNDYKVELRLRYYF